MKNGHFREMTNLILVEIDLIKKGKIYIYSWLKTLHTNGENQEKKHLASKSVLVETFTTQDQITGRK